ncbi:hypothetical protein FW774_16630 [Pedobacter sp. BS3]|uniref:helix-turn-helix transcriptional regulator n=1 Tax=Pedobacter sp. BS3 TaxID=2567937 RepID=UPI0011EFFCAD|nr:LuxR C-terminal-related transcriptional regulator [Pedobacter sp. BS3]TZF82309.1 hypothetical protein FW774_16630 [Pedobacter sp. BS3]
MHTRFLFAEPEFLGNFTRQLKLEWDAYGTGPYSLVLQQQMALLEEMAVMNSRVFSVFDIKKIKYLFYTKNLFKFLGVENPHGDERWESNYMTRLEDIKLFENYARVRQQIRTMLSYEERLGQIAVVCGAFLKMTDNKLKRTLFQSKPVLFDADGNADINFDALSDIQFLMTDQPGYWIRVATGDRVFHWHSMDGRLKEKDLLSSREKELLLLWYGGHSIPQIAILQQVSIQTVKNQFNAMRKRFFARDTTALLQLCMMTGVLNANTHQLIG